MTVSWSWVVEACLGQAITDEAGESITDEAGNEISDHGWLDISADVMRDETIEWSQGIQGTSMTDLVASSGTLSLVLDNDVTNSWGAQGAYTPNHANVCSDLWLRDIAVRIGIVYLGRYDYYVYYLSKIEPSAGQFLAPTVELSGEDWISRAALANVPPLAVQVGQRPDQLIASILAATGAPPINATINTEPQTVFTYALHTESDGTKLLTVLQKIAQSAGGAIFVDSDETDGETLRYEHRLMRPARAVIAALDNSMSDLEASWSVEETVDLVRVQYNPGRVDTVDQVLGSMPSPQRIPAGGGVLVELRLRDPDGLANNVSALSLVTLVSGTDYLASSIEGDGGQDLNASLSIARRETTASSVSYYLVNTAAVPMYVSLFQQHGKGIYLYDPIFYALGAESPIMPSEYNGQYMSNYFDAKNFAEMLYSRLHDETRPEVGRVGFYADYDSTFFRYFSTGHIGHPYTLTEAVTGLATRKFYINGRTMRIERNTLYVEWIGEPADRYTYIQCDASHPLDDGNYVLA